MAGIRPAGQKYDYTNYKRWARFMPVTDHDVVFFVDWVNNYWNLPLHSPLSKATLPWENAKKEKIELNPAGLDRDMRADMKALLETEQELGWYPLGGETQHPIMDINDDWNFFIATGCQTYKDFFSSYLALVLYRRIAQDRYQTDGHMKLLHTCALLAEWYKKSVVMSDDAFTGTTHNEGKPTWQATYPICGYNDENCHWELVVTGFKKIIPRRHPCHDEMLVCVEEWMRRSQYNICYMSWMRDKRTKRDAILAANPRHPIARQKACPLPLEVCDYEAAFSQSWYSTDQHMHMFADIARYCAGYREIDSLKWYENLSVWCRVLTSFESWESIVIKESLWDITTGEAKNILLPTAIKIADELEAAGKATESAEIWETLRMNFGTGHDEDGARVVALYRKYGVIERARLFMEERAADWVALSRELVDEFPADALNRALLYYFNYDPTRRMIHYTERDRVMEVGDPDFIPKTGMKGQRIAELDLDRDVVKCPPNGPWPVADGKDSAGVKALTAAFAPLRAFNVEVYKKK